MEDPTMDDLLEGFGIDPAAAGPDPAPTGDPDPAPEGNSNAGDPAPSGDPAPDTGAEPNSNDPTPANTDPEPEPEPDKQQQAFIYLRQQNQTYKNTLKGVAEVLGIDPKSANDTDLLAALQNKVTENQAQKSGVPVEMLQRLNMLETRNAQIEHAERERAALLGIQQVKDKFGLDDKTVTKFTQDLIRNGMNPLEDRVNFIKEYRDMHFEELQQKAIEDAVAKEQARAAKANNSATAPDKNRGDPGNSDGKITTQAQLNSWLDAQTKK